MRVTPARKEERVNRLWTKVTGCPLDGITQCDITKTCAQCKEDEELWRQGWLNKSEDVQ